MRHHSLNGAWGAAVPWACVSFGGAQAMALPKRCCRGVLWRRWCCFRRGAGGLCRDASEGEGPQRRPQQRLGRRLEGVAEAVGGGYCRLQMPLKRALGVRGTVAGRRLGGLEGGGGYPPPPFPMHPWGRVSESNSAARGICGFEIYKMGKGGLTLCLPPTPPALHE